MRVSSEDRMVLFSKRADPEAYWCRVDDIRMRRLQELDPEYAADLEAITNKDDVSEWRG